MKHLGKTPQRRATDRVPKTLERHTPLIEIHGPVIVHDVCCPVYFHQSAVYDKDTGIFFPSLEAQRDGYILLRVRNKWWRAISLWLFGIR